MVKAETVLHEACEAYQAAMAREVARHKENVEAVKRGTRVEEVRVIDAAMHWHFGGYVYEQRDGAIETHEVKR